MNARQSIQPSTTPAVLSIAFSLSRKRFIAGLSSGAKVFCSDNCLATYAPSFVPDRSKSSVGGNERFASGLRSGGCAIAEALDDRYIAMVGGGRVPAGSPNVVVFLDCVLEHEVQSFDFYEPVLGIRINQRFMVVILRERSVVFSYQELQEVPLQSRANAASIDTLTAESVTPMNGPNAIVSIHQTTPNVYALAGLTERTLVLPAQTPGQVQIVPLPNGSKRIHKAHKAPLRCFALSPDGTLLVTASEKGTLVRVHDVATLSQIAEFRRGSDSSVILGLAMSTGNRWVACTSDKGTVHVFDLRPPPSSVSPIVQRAESTKPVVPAKCQVQSHGVVTNTKQPILALGERDSSSGLSTPKRTQVAPSYQGSNQEYYGVRPPPPSASSISHATATTAYTAFKASPFAPKILKDVRSVASAPFNLGTDPPYWQGGTPHTWTTAPDGTRKRVRNVIPPLPADPSGRPPKGLLAFAAPDSVESGTTQGDESSAVLYVISGGSDAQWEIFDLTPADDGWVLAQRGFRKFLQRQFVD